MEASTSKSSKSSKSSDSPYEQAVDQGYIGVQVDPTPNDNYTIDGVTSGAATPETDADAKAAADARLAELSDELSGGSG